MKIGVMSMQRIVNYGSYMQAYGLKTMLEELGADVCFVDYTVGMTIALRNYFKNSSCKWLGLLKRKINEKTYSHTQSSVCREFLDCYSRLGLDQVKHYRTKVDTLIIGSDEVFNCLQANPDVGYSLELFGKNNCAKRLISYAASFGNTTLDRLKENTVDAEIGRYLKKFDAISVRDMNSANIVEELTGRKPLQNLDPALVGNVEKQNWKPCHEKNFMIVYGYANRFSEEEGKAIVEFATKRKLKLIVLNGKQQFCETFFFCRPDEILGYFEKAKYVVTDTFHGTIFSILFHRPVAVFCRNSVNYAYSNENKLLDLLEKFNLNKQLVKSPKELETILEQPIDYEEIDRYRKEEREKSMNYLKQYCKD